MKKFTLALLGSVLSLGATPSVAQTPFFPLPSDNVRVVPQSNAQVQLSYAPVVKETAPAVVNVFTARTIRRNSQDEFFDMMFNMRRAPAERTQSSLGSGVIVRSNGLIVTNAHVVKGADELKVVLNDRREFAAELLSKDEELDLAILQIDPGSERLPSLNIQGDQDLEIGDIVLAIGNPFGVGQTVTSGIVSAKGRTNVSDFSSYIQTDAAVNPGNSGGALVNLNGELVGINTAIFSRSGGSNGIGFAIPAELVSRAVDSTLTDGKIIRPWLGARTNAVDSALAATLGLDRAQGTIISEIYPGSPAAKAGLKERDVILKLAGTDINDEPGLNFKLATLARGSKAETLVWRDGRERTLKVDVDVPKEVPARDERFLDGIHPLDGATVVNMSPALGDELGVDPYLSGVMILSVARRSVASYNRFRPGDIVVDINDTEIINTMDLENQLTALDSTEQWGVRIDRNGRLYNVPIRYLPRVD
ncbi:MAG: Do family serine endopeptidase [Hellea sp.]|nr:Do family serine endopeptidase [Hellea sp.]